MAVLKVYKDVIEDVLSAAREMFLEDGVDEQVLQELKQSWEAKLIASKAVDNKTEVEKQTVTKKSNNHSQSNTSTVNNSEVANGNGVAKHATNAQAQQAAQQQLKQVVGQVAPNNHVQTPQQINAAAAAAAQAQAQQQQAAVAAAAAAQQQHQVVETKMVPIQITLPAQPGTNGPQRMLTIQVPAAALNDNLLHKVLTGQVITTTMNLPPSIASSVLQQHVNAAFSQLAPGMMSGIVTQTPSSQTKTVIQNDGAADDEDVQFEIKVLRGEALALNLNEASTSKVRVKAKTKLRKKKERKLKKMRIVFVRQCDGPVDTSDDDDASDDDDEISDNDDDDKEDDEQEMDDGGPEEEPLNSEDDVTDEDPTDLFDTDNVVVCQYDKITRSRNKWKFHLKDGIMNLKGEDYVFQKANGDAEW